MGVSRQIAGSLGAYLKAQLQNFAIIAGLYLIGFALTGVPWWPVTGVLCGLLNPIPYFGSLLALGIAVLLKWLATENWVQIAWVGGVWLAIQAIDGFVLSPRAAGRAGVHPLLSILITLVAGFMFGPLGMIVAVPVVAIILVVWRASKAQPR